MITEVKCGGVIEHGPPLKVIEILDPLSVAVIAGLLDTIRKRYPVPDAVPAGIVIGILSESEVELMEPTTVGEAKLPLALDISTVKVFPALNVPVPT
jgi:hypothetical protein